MHALRHVYASVQLEAGTSVRAPAECLGQADPGSAECLGRADPGFTLRVYMHPMPTSENRARQAVDAALFLTLSDQVASTAAP